MSDVIDLNRNELEESNFKILIQKIATFAEIGDKKEIIRSVIVSFEVRPPSIDPLPRSQNLASTGKQHLIKFKSPKNHQPIYILSLFQIKCHKSESANARESAINRALEGSTYPG